MKIKIIMYKIWNVYVCLKEIVIYMYKQCINRVNNDVLIVVNK